MRGLICWIFFQGKPMRSIAPGPKFSTITSQVSISLVKMRVPASVLGLSVMLRLLAFSIVK